MTDAPQTLWHHHLKTLRLPTFKGEYAKQAQLCAAENKDHVQYLARRCEMELIDRERRMIERRIKAAKFPSTKSLDRFDFKIMPSLNKPLTMELALCEYVDRRENTIALGPSGTGKTHIALGLGLAACQRGLKVRFTTAAALVHVTATNTAAANNNNKGIKKIRTMLAKGPTCALKPFSYLEALPLNRTKSDSSVDPFHAATWLLFTPRLTLWKARPLDRGVTKRNCLPKLCDTAL